MVTTQSQSGLASSIIEMGVNSGLDVGSRNIFSSIHICSQQFEMTSWTDTLTLQPLIGTTAKSAMPRLAVALTFPESSKREG